MKIAILSGRDITTTGGCEVFTLNLFARLAANQHDVTIYTPTSLGTKELKKLAKGNCRIRSLPPTFPTIYRRAPLVAKLLLLIANRLNHYDVWQGMGAYPEGVCLELVARETTCFIRLFGEDVQICDELNYGVRRNPKIDHLICNALRHFNIIAMTKSLAQNAIDSGADASSVRIIPNAIDYARLSNTHSRDDFRKSLGITDDTMMILTVGRNHPKKQFERIPDIARLLKNNNWKWFIVGSGTESLSPMIHSYKLEHKIILVPPHNYNKKKEILCSMPPDSLLKYFQSADIFALPSRLEGFSRVIAEAMGAGVCIVTTNAPGCGEIIEHGTHGLVSPVSDDVSFAANIDQIIKNTALRTSMQQNCKDFARTLSWERIIEQYEQAYSELIMRARNAHE